MTQTPRITLERSRTRVRVIANGETVADSDNAILLSEKGYPPVFYLPPGDVRRELFEQTRHATHCPHKGDATYWTVTANGERIENIAWCYEHPKPQVAAIKGHFAFYMNKAEIAREGAPS